MLLVFLLYLLLSMRFTVRLCAGVSGAQGSVCASIGTLGLWVRFDGVIAPEGKRPRIRPRYGHKKKNGRKLRQRYAGYQKLKPWIRAILPSVDIERLEIGVLVGLGQADHTAVAVGAIRASVSALLAALGIDSPVRLCVHACFEHPAFLARGYCIFSLAPGDIMFAAARYALRKTRREGFGWISIPLRA